METILKKYAVSPPKSLSEQVQMTAKERVNIFLQEIDTAFLLRVGLVSSLVQLVEFDFTSYVRACISQVRFVF